MKQSTVKVTFLPGQQTVAVPRGTTLLTAARQAGVYINSICGGDGICGKCKLVVSEGDVSARPTTLLRREEVRRSVVLACQTEVISDVVVEVPPESGEGAKILIDRDAQRFRALYAPLEEQLFFRYDPLVQKIHLELSPPTLHDNISDQARVYRGIRQNKECGPMQTGLKIIRGIPALLRENHWDVTATLGTRGAVVELIQLEGADTTGPVFGIAVDVGTSTVVTHLVDLNRSNTVDAEATYNSQRSFGAEVTRRITYAELNDPDILRQAIVDDINNLITALISRNNIRLHDILAVVCAGNTAMIHFLLGLNPSSIRKEPYVSVSVCPPAVRAAEVGIGINPRGLLYSLPGIAGWVGADINAGVLATGIYKAEHVQMLIDIGTNGEIVLGSREWMVCCSASAGPAFEGTGVHSGMRAASGAIEQASIGADGSVRFMTIGNVWPHGICGSGLIDIIAGLFSQGFIDRSGRLVLSRGAPVREGVAELEFLVVPAFRTSSGEDIVVTQADIENILRAKAAIFAALSVLLSQVQISMADIERIYLAGGFGNYLNKDNAVTLGLIPDVARDTIQFVGNTSILGAKMALLSTDALHELYNMSRDTTYYDLTTYAGYMDEFMSAKFIPHTDLDRFPSVRIGKEVRAI